MTKQSINMGLIGAGRIGRLHAEILTTRIPAAKLVMVADAFPESAKACAADFGIPEVASSPKAIFDSDQIEAVAICSSTDTHAPFIIQAAQAGKHIFCEKPIALDLASIDQALTKVENSGVKLQVGFNRRFHANFKHIRDVVAEGKIGTPHLVRITSRDPEPPPVSYVKVSGGIFLDMTIHDFDMARYLIGSEVEEVYATGGVRVDPAIGQAGDIDTAVIVLTYQNGAICTIDNSREAVYGYDQRVEVFGSEGMVAADNNAPHNTIYYTRAGGTRPLPYWFFLELYFDAYVAEMKAFVEAVQNDTPPLVTGLDGRYPLLMGLAAGKSLRERRPVKLSEIEG
ncbi:MAG: inositol 2-dehydrogenase [Anaerolineae bacterium]|nr:inositol 2-dehydrogenase [Anaerolineae bacterium]